MTGLFVPDDIPENITDESDHRSCSVAVQETPRRRARSNVARRNPVMFDARAVARRFSQKLGEATSPPGLAQEITG